MPDDRRGLTLLIVLEGCYSGRKEIYLKGARLDSSRGCVDAAGIIHASTRAQEKGNREEKSRFDH
ncbi:hypothetical protein [Caballeronia sp. INDeC2]|uniref:hypothetical protein n=1 Tax=Caballeronia sp. INDeC2 TaxID=2921747 RepID=UPI002028ABAC|nr:hypothetical protein [Caballeronia sp. INDeC2]